MGDLTLDPMHHFQGRLKPSTQHNTQTTIAPVFAIDGTAPRLPISLAATTKTKKMNKVTILVDSSDVLPKSFFASWIWRT